MKAMIIAHQVALKALVRASPAQARTEIEDQAGSAQESLLDETLSDEAIDLVEDTLRQLLT